MPSKPSQGMCQPASPLRDTSADDAHRVCAAGEERGGAAGACRAVQPGAGAGKQGEYACLPSTQVCAWLATLATVSMACSSGNHERGLQHGQQWACKTCNLQSASLRPGVQLRASTYRCLRRQCGCFVAQPGAVAHQGAFTRTAQTAQGPTPTLLLRLIREHLHAQHRLRKGPPLSWAFASGQQCPSGPADFVWTDGM